MPENAELQAKQRAAIAADIDKIPRPVTVANIDATMRPWAAAAIEGDVTERGAVVVAWREALKRASDYPGLDAGAPESRWDDLVFSSDAARDLYDEVRGLYGRELSYGTTKNSARNAPLSVISVAAVESGAVQLTPEQRGEYDAALKAGDVRPDGSVSLTTSLVKEIQPDKGESWIGGHEVLPDRPPQLIDDTPPELKPVGAGNPTNDVVADMSLDALDTIRADASDLVNLSADPIGSGDVASMTGPKVGVGAKVIVVVALVVLGAWLLSKGGK